MDTKRLRLLVSKELYDWMDQTIIEGDCLLDDLLTQGVALLVVGRQARADGKYFGICNNPANLDTEIVGMMDEIERFKSMGYNIFTDDDDEFSTSLIDRANIQNGLPNHFFIIVAQIFLVSLIILHYNAQWCIQFC